MRLPWGTEVWFGDKQPRIGDRLSRRGTVYVVKLIENEEKRVVVSVAPSGEDAGSPPER